MIAAVEAALFTKPTHIHVADFTLKCNRKDTCRPFIPNLIEKSLASNWQNVNVIATDFFTQNTLGLHAITYNWLKATTSEQSPSIADQQTKISTLINNLSSNLSSLTQ